MALALRPGLVWGTAYGDLAGHADPGAEAVARLFEGLAAG